MKQNRKKSSAAQCSVEGRSWLPSIVSVNSEALRVVAQSIQSFLVTLSPLKAGCDSLCSTREFFRLHLHKQVVGATSCICGAEQLLLRTQCPHSAYVLQTKTGVILYIEYSPEAGIRVLEGIFQFIFIQKESR